MSNLNYNQDQLTPDQINQEHAQRTAQQLQARYGHSMSQEMHETPTYTANSGGDDGFQYTVDQFPERPLQGYPMTGGILDLLGMLGISVASSQLSDGLRGLVPDRAIQNMQDWLPIHGSGARPAPGGLEPAARPGGQISRIGGSLSKDAIASQLQAHLDDHTLDAIPPQALSFREPEINWGRTITESLKPSHISEILSLNGSALRSALSGSERRMILKTAMDTWTNDRTQVSAIPLVQQLTSMTTPGEPLESFHPGYATIYRGYRGHPVGRDGVSAFSTDPEAAKRFAVANWSDKVRQVQATPNHQALSFKAIRDAHDLPGNRGESEVTLNEPNSGIMDAIQGPRSNSGILDAVPSYQIRR